MMILTKPNPTELGLERYTKLSISALSKSQFSFDQAIVFAILVNSNINNKSNLVVIWSNPSKTRSVISITYEPYMNSNPLSHYCQIIEDLSSYLHAAPSNIIKAMHSFRWIKTQYRESFELKYGT